ncbi:hypothetical protein BJY01DRAFT_209728 [Aspergillus pseudoustus]|uniref:Uncharacterized protein n=1 Tax=Aspergillus pseudoustus TaxID=1810923 RepID=A0ABR4KEF4_9EURO
MVNLLSTLLLLMMATKNSAMKPAPSADAARSAELSALAMVLYPFVSYPFCRRFLRKSRAVHRSH